MKHSMFKALIVLLLGILPQLGYTAVPRIISYQAFLSDTSGKPVDGTIDITFSIPDTTWKEVHTGVPVKQGVFGLYLGNKTSFSEVDFSQQRSLRIEYKGTSQTVPLAMIDGHETSLEDLNCAKDQIIKFNGTAWECATPKSASTGGSNGSVFTRWGNATAPEGTTLLDSGFAFSGRYTQGGGGGEPICMISDDPGAPGPGTYYGDLLYPLGTGDATRMPPGISPLTEIKCAVSYAEGPSFERWGTQTCPTGWMAAYTGYAMGGFYNHNHQSNRHCVDNTEYDYSVASPNYGGIWYGTVLYTNQDVGIYEENRYVKCALCIKN